MKYLLDTNVCINFLNGRSNNIRNELERHSPQEIFLCSIVVAELYYGSIKSARPVENIQRIAHFIDHFVSLPFDNHASRVYGEIRSVLETSGQPIGPMDLLIASIAVSHNLVLITHNTREFDRIKGLKINDWEKDN
jgi:tRNA(fMet)-specific endonuclease VapC